MPSLSKMRHLSREHARRFVVRRHMLAPPRALPPSADSVLAVTRRLGSLQFDPIDVPGARNHDLVLHARVAGYERAWCDGWLYGPERRLVEVYNKSLNLVPIDELPWHRLAWERAAQRHAKGALAQGATVAPAVFARITAEGSAGAAAVAVHGDLLPPRHHGGELVDRHLGALPRPVDGEEAQRGDVDPVEVVVRVAEHLAGLLRRGVRAAHGRAGRPRGGGR